MEFHCYSSTIVVAYYREKFERRLYKEARVMPRIQMIRAQMLLSNLLFTYKIFVLGNLASFFPFVLPKSLKMGYMKLQCLTYAPRISVIVHFCPDHLKGPWTRWWKNF